MKTICLNMIVKNESHVIKRCLDSVKGVIDYWVIFDTGSTDGTQAKIREILKDIPGELHERPWVNFEHNRNEALHVARNKADYIFFIDADEELVISKPFDKSLWNQDFYMIKAKGEASSFFHPNIINNDPGWIWQGVLHECITQSKKMSGEILSDIYMNRPQDGARSLDPNKYQKDLDILHAASQKEPWNARHVFYLAQTYSVLADFPSALKYYEKRALMSGDKDELFWSLFRIGVVQETLEMDSQTIIASYSRAHQHTPYRAEPIERLANHYNSRKFFSLAYMICKHAVTMRMPTALNSDFFPWVYEYGLLLQLADAAFGLKLFEEAIEHYQNLLKKTTLPKHLEPLIKKQIVKARQGLEKQSLQEYEYCL